MTAIAIFNTRVVFSVLLVLLACLSYVADASCATDKECSNNGNCNAVSQTCDCETPWSGASCDIVQLVGFNCSVVGNTHTCKCEDASPILDTTSKQCRARIAADCTGTTPVLANGLCRGYQPSDCTTDAPIFVNATHPCRKRTQLDCDKIPSTPLLDPNTKICRVYNQSDCTADAPVLGSPESGCRKRTQSDCDKIPSTPLLDPNTKICRVYKNSDCSGGTPVLVSPDAGCRARNPGDCGNQILDATTQTCRDRVASDCNDPNNSKFNAATKTCVATISCAIVEADLRHPGEQGNCPSNTMEKSTSCTPTCEAGLAATGSVTCSAAGVLENDFFCQLITTVGMSGVTPDNFEQDPKLTETFKSTIVELTNIDGAAITSVVAAAPGTEASMSTTDVTFKIRVDKAGEQETIKSAISDAVADGSFSTTYKENMKKADITSVDIDDVQADDVQHIDPQTPSAGPDGEGPNNSADQSIDGENGGSNNGGLIAGLVVFAVAVGVGAVWFFKFRKPSKQGMNKLDSNQQLEIENPAANNTGNTGNLELQNPQTVEEGGAVFASDK